MRWPAPKGVISVSMSYEQETEKFIKERKEEVKKMIKE